MKKSIKRTVSIFLSLVCAVLLISFAFNANAADDGKVRVVVQNTTYSTANGAAWDGVLLDEWVSIDSDSTMQNVVEKALNAENVSFTFNSWNYLASINGLSEYDYNGSGGWMMTLNDWFTTQASSEYTVANNGLQNGDEVFVMYSSSWGADIGSLWGNSDTSLSSIGISNGALDKSFDSSVKDYTLYVMKDSDGVYAAPEAVNKNYQVRTYKNEYKPETNGAEIKRSAKIDVSENDVIYIGVGNTSWPSMNDPSTESVYTLTVKYAPQLGDFDQDGERNVNDATMMCRYLVGLDEFSQMQQFIANVNQDKYVDVLDVNAIQKIAAGIDIN